MNNLIGFVGFKNSGKNTAALVLENLDYIPMSFADSLKDCLSAIFGWPREMLNGTTPESRKWRETIDTWWSERLGIPDFTPRLAMQMVATDCFRKHFHPDIWVSSVERKIDHGGNFVFTDIRYPNEISLIKRKGGRVFRIRKGPEPEWFEIAIENNKFDSNLMGRLYPKIHESEFAWIGSSIDGIIENDSSIEVLHERVLSKLVQF